MRMTKESLRRIVREAVKAKLARLDEGPPRTEYDEHMEVIASAIAHQLTEKLEDEVTFSNAGEMIMGTIADDQLLRPSDYEGVEPAAKKIAEMVVGQLREELERFATDMLHSLMEPS